MNKFLSITAALLAATTVSAQGTVASGSLTTTTGYGDFADAGGQPQVQGVAQGTQISPRGLKIGARDGGALAQTRIGFGQRANARVLGVNEHGEVAVRGRGQAAAGTSDNHQRISAGSHGLSWNIPARQGTKAVVTVSWRGGASSGASTGATVDVDGDGRPDFSARANGNRYSASERFRVQAGARGFAIGISTRGAARQNGTGRQTYGGQLTVAIHHLRSGPAPSPSAAGCSFKAFGPECAGALSGRAAAGTNVTRVGIHLTGAAPNARAGLFIGNALRSPVQLPGSRCSLLVSRRVILGGQTDARGNASWQLRVPSSAAGIGIDFQALTLSAGRTGAQFGSSNGLHMQCR